MKTFNARESANREILISINELNQLLQWAKVVVSLSLGGSYFETIISTIKEYARKSGHYTGKVTWKDGSQ